MLIILIPANLMQMATVNNCYTLIAALFSMLIISSYSLSFIASDKPSQRGHLHSSVYVIPDEGDSVVFRCTQEEERAVKAWILPNGDHVVLNEESKSTVRPNGTLDLRDHIVFTKHAIEIPSIKVGMDGKYTCMVENDRLRRSFYIPYVVSHIGFSQSALLSLSISVVFSAMCLVVILVECYCNSAQKLEQEQEPARKGIPAALEGTSTLDSTSLGSVSMELDTPPLFHDYSAKYRLPNLPEMVVSEA